MRKTKPERQLPDPTVCRTRQTIMGGRYACLVENPVSCPHVVCFGEAFFCNHPLREQYSWLV